MRQFAFDNLSGDETVCPKGLRPLALGHREGFRRPNGRKTFVLEIYFQIMWNPARFVYLFFLVFAAAPSVFAQPVVYGLANNYSGTKAGLPNYGISPGSLFIIVGSDLATSSNTAEMFPLNKVLNGTTVSVTVNGTMTQPTLYYVLPTQIGAVLPEDTPLGTGTLTVSNGGQTSAPVSIQVVQSDFGILTDNGAGFGPAAAFDTSYNPVTATHPATPGQLIVFWGTGVGPDPMNDDSTEPQHTNNLTSIPMNVYIGGVSASVYYKGRSAYPGVDELFVYVPSGVPEGCYVSVVTLSGSITSNYATIPVAPSGASTCTDQISIFNDWQALAGKTSANIGKLYLASETMQTATGTQTTSGAEGQFKTDSAAEIYSELFSDRLISVGNCVVDQGNSAGTPTVISAGPNLTLSGPGGEQVAFQYSPGATPAAYKASLSSTFIPSQGGTFTFSGAGGSGAQIGSFNASVTLPPAITWTNMSAASNIVRSQGFTMNWTGGTPDGLVSIIGDSTGTAGVDVKFGCMASAAAGTFTIPPEVLLSLPNTTTSASLGIINLENPVTFSASGLDLGFVYGGFESVTTLANYQATATPAPQLQSVSFPASQVTGGSSIQGTVVLSSPAPAAGVTVDLSSNSSAVSVPASVTVPSGATSATFTASAGPVTSTQTVTITATYAGASVQASLTVNPQSTGVDSFNGNYTGTYTGTRAGKTISGSVSATVNNGTVTVTQPGSGTGTISATGQITFGVDISEGVSCNFSGDIVLMGTEATGSGTFSCSSENITGTWSVTSQSTLALATLRALPNGIGR